MLEHLSNCHGEITNLLLSIPFLGAGWAWLRAKLHHRKHHTDCPKEPSHKGKVYFNRDGIDMD